MRDCMLLEGHPGPRDTSLRAPRIAGLVLCILLFGTILAPHKSAAAPSVPKKGTYFGSYVQPEGWSRGQQKVAVNQLEGDLGRRLDIDHLFYRWDREFPGWRQAWDIRKGRIPMVSWGGTYLNQVLNGTHDAMIRARANAMRSLRAPVLLRWFAEMDASIYDGDEIESPEQFVSAWRRIHDIFVDRNANNVEWVWCPNAGAFATGEAQEFYPGDAYVDWICADGYNWAPAREGSPWVSFREIFAAFYEWGAPQDLPLLIGETGVMENDPGDKAAWIRSMGATIKNAYPEIRALVYFDAYATANFGGWYDWRVDTSSSSYEAYRKLGSRRFFQGDA